MKQSTTTVKTYGSEVSNEEKFHQRDWLHFVSSQNWFLWLLPVADCDHRELEWRQLSYPELLTQWGPRD